MIEQEAKEYDEHLKDSIGYGLTYIDKNNQDAETLKSRKMREIIRKVEDRVFLGTTNSYNVYKEFDIDKDGYISEKDLINKSDQMNILQ